MPRFLALEWDAREARVAVARTRGGGDIVVEHAFMVDLELQNGQTPAEAEVGQRVAAALAARNLGRTETLVAVGRTNIELRQLALPPSPVEELPELVRFQALRQFTTINEEWPIDFVHVDSGESESLHVIAAAISPDLVTQIKGTCESAELTAKRLILRPFAAASLLHRHDKNRRPPCTLMVDLLAEEADLTVMVDNRVAMMRTVRMSTGNGAEAQSRALLGEMRRTIAAAQNQLSGHRVERVVLCGDGSEQSTLKTLIEEQLSFQVELFDPFSQLQVETELAANKPAHPGRFAPLLGMLADEAAGAAHAIDFLHPREKPATPSRWRSNGLYVGLGVAVCAALVLMLVVSRLNLDARIAALQEESKGLDKSVEKAAKKIDNVSRVEDFLSEDFVWLDELKGLSDTLPPADDIILTQLSMIVAPNGGQLSLDGFARESNQIKDVQRSLRESGRQSTPKGGGVDERRDEYKWHFKEVVVLSPKSDVDLKLTAPPDPASAEVEPESPDQDVIATELNAADSDEEGPETPDEAAATPDTATTTPDEPATTPEPATTTPEPATTTPEPATTTPEPATTTPEPATTTPEPTTTTTDEPAATPAPAATPEPATTTPEPATTTTDEPAATPEPATTPDEPAAPTQDAPNTAPASDIPPTRDTPTSTSP